MPIIIDFNGFSYGDDKFMIREYSLLIIDKTGNIELNDLGVVEPLCDWEELDEETQQNYQQEFYSNFGIDWDVGTSNLETTTNSIIEKLSLKETVYIRDNEHKESLINFLGTELNNRFISLVEDLEYDEPLKMSTYCILHDHPRQYNCAIDNVWSMYQWLEKMKKYRKRVPKSKEVKKHVVVDFIGYYIPEDQFVIKEFNAIVIDDVENIFSNKKNLHFITEKPPDLQLKTMPFDYQVLYQAFYDTFGISWNAGDFKFLRYPKKLRKYFDKSVNIYVRYSGIKRLLMDIIGKEYRDKIVVLQKLGYQEQPKMKTLCRYHDRAWKNNCAVDNSRSIVYWIMRNNDKFGIV